MWPHSITPYAVLGVAPNATTETIRARWRATAARNHPDRGGDADAMALANAAYDLLTDRKQRELYDKHFLPKCPACGGTGWLKRQKGFRTVTVRCPDCGGSND